MPTSIDLLKAKRDSGYGTNAPTSSGGDRSISLTPEEMQIVGQKGEGTVTCMITGTLSPDGKLMIDSVSAPSAEGYGDKPMPVMPPSQISPS